MCYNVYYHFVNFRFKTLPMYGEIKKGQIVFEVIWTKEHSLELGCKLDNFWIIGWTQKVDKTD